MFALNQAVQSTRSTKFLADALRVRIVVSRFVKHERRSREYTRIDLIECFGDAELCRCGGELWWADLEEEQWHLVDEVGS